MMTKFLNSAVILPSVRILSWNVNGLRSFLRHDEQGINLSELLNRRNVDILCLQETKLQEMHVPDVEEQMRKILSPDSRYFWYCSTGRKGYSGTATIVLNKAVEVSDVNYGNHCEDGNIEGRMITVHTPQFSLINTYVPNSGDKLVRLDFRTKIWDKQFQEYIHSLRSESPSRPIILTGDFNVAHTDLDHFNYLDPRAKKVAGTTPAEKESFHTHFLTQGFWDTYREAFPTERGYSYYSARKGRIGRQMRQGWRLDYVLTDLSYSIDKVPSLPYIEEEVRKRENNTI
mmetsp:Transcript_37342/g.38023  ORF Transcript_37342/g.38023 Transcript_37342/m.38023 type:complete len:287 (+) Transcript_37342:93-953(+)